MDTTPKAVWPKYYTQLSLVFTFILLSVFAIFFFKRIMPFPILIFGFAVIVFFFVGLNNYSVRWQNLTEKDFTNRLFWHSFFYRIIFVIILYLITLWFDPTSFPFEVQAADSWTYHGAAHELSAVLFNGKFLPTLNSLFYSRDDFGFPIYLSLIYSLFRSGSNAFLISIPVRLLNCLWGSLMVVYISKIARMVFSDEDARLAGIIAMLMPPFLWFGGMQLKETLMIFLIVLIAYHAIKIVHLKRINITSIALIIVLSFSLFYFRTYLAGLVVSCIAFYFFLNFSKQRVNKLAVVVALLFFVAIEYFLITRYGYYQKIVQNFNLANINQFQQGLAINAARVGVSFKAGSVTLYALLGAVLTPFPAFLYLEASQLPILLSYQNELVRNIMYFFAFFGIFVSLKNKFRDVSLILMFAVGTIFAAAISGFSVYDRFQLPALPFLIIFMAEGVKQSNSKIVRLWVVYLLILMAAILVWNIFKLNIRGMF